MIQVPPEYIALSVFILSNNENAAVFYVPSIYDSTCFLLVIILPSGRTIIIRLCYSGIEVLLLFSIPYGTTINRMY